MYNTALNYVAPPAGHRVIRPQIEVAPETGPWHPIAGKRLLVLADVENLTYSARNHLNCKLSYRGLAERMNGVARSCSLHAFFSRPPTEEDRWSRYFEERGWVPHPRDIVTVKTCRGLERQANSDNLILFTAGLLASRSSAEVIVIASGDGNLACDLANAITELPKSRQVVTLSLAGSTAARLDARSNRTIAANIEIGRDCLRPIRR